MGCFDQDAVAVCPPARNGFAFREDGIEDSAERAVNKFAKTRVNNNVAVQYFYDYAVLRGQRAPVF